MSTTPDGSGPDGSGPEGGGPDRSGPGGADSGGAVADGTRRLRLLQLASLTSTVDRFAIAPLLVPIAASFDAPLAAAAGAAGGYFLAYGLMHPVTVAAAGLCLGGAWAFLHSTLQTWATEVVPQARATAVALFATLLFLGSSAGTALGAPFADAGRFAPLFAAALVASVPLALVAALARARYARRAA